MPEHSPQPTGELIATSARNDRIVAHVDRMETLLDECITLPGGYKIGLDGLIGLVPGIGDAIGSGLSAWIVYQAHRVGVPRFVLARMIGNVVLDSTIGAVPVLGDMFDFFWKSNRRNLRLLRKYRCDRPRTYSTDHKH